MNYWDGGCLHLPIHLVPQSILSANVCSIVNFPVVTGGFALLAASGLAGGGLSTSIIPLVGAGTIGLLGAGVAAMMFSQCVGPIRCRAPSGQCCLLLFNRAGAVCPSPC